MTRRELIQKTTLALGYSLSAPAMMGILSGCEARHELSYKPTFFTDEQAIAIGDLADIILPRTSTPGAKDVGVPSFIDTFIRAVYSKEDQAKFVRELDAFITSTVPKHFRSFTECTPDLQLSYAQDIHRQAFRNAGTEEAAWWNNSKMERPFIIKVKELTILGYYSSEVGATKVLQYNPAPGPYQGCVPLTQVGKAWSTS